MTLDRSYVIEHEELGATLMPTRVMLDPRIPLKARGLYAVLRSIPAGTRLNDAALQALSDHDGRDAMRAAKRTLCMHGLLQIQQDRANAGRFSRTVWLLRSASSLASVDGFSVYGGSVTGQPARGCTDDGKPARGENPLVARDSSDKPEFRSSVRSNTFSKTTTYNSERPSFDASLLIPPQSLTTSQAQTALRMVTPLPIEMAQEVLDELEGIKRKGAIKKTWEACLHGIIRAAHKGEFNYTVGREILAERERRSTEQQQAQARAAERKARKPSSPEVARAGLDEINALLGKREASC